MPNNHINEQCIFPVLDSVLNHWYAWDASAIVHLLYTKSRNILSWDWSNLQFIVLEMDLKITYSINTWWARHSLGMCLFLLTLTTVSLTVEQKKCVLLFRGRENKGTGLFALYFPLFKIKYWRECGFLKIVFTSVTAYRLGLQIFIKYLQNVVLFWNNTVKFS